MEALQPLSRISILPKQEKYMMQLANWCSHEEFDKLDPELVYTTLKVPVPMMPFIEFFGIFTKPFALMIRLFANMLAGHMAMLVLTCLIFISASMGPALNGTLTVASVLFNIFMNALELLVAFIQAYVFTMLSAVFIGLAQEGAKVKAEEN